MVGHTGSRHKSARKFNETPCLWQAGKALGAWANADPPTRNALRDGTYLGCNCLTHLCCNHERSIIMHPPFRVLVWMVEDSQQPAERMEIRLVPRPAHSVWPVPVQPHCFSRPRPQHQHLRGLLTTASHSSMLLAQRYEGCV